MAGRETVATLGARRSRVLRLKIGDELGRTRVAAGLSVREVARRVGVGPARVERAERGEAGSLTIDLAARIAPVIGLQLAAHLFPDGDPLRDRAHLALLNRLRDRLPRSLALRVEVAMPIAGDRRSGDAVIEGTFGSILVEAETRVTDLQAVERKATLKQRDLGAERLILLISDTTNNRTAVAFHPEVRERFPVTTRRCLAALARGEDPGGDCLVML